MLVRMMSGNGVSRGRWFMATALFSLAAVFAIAPAVDTAAAAGSKPMPVVASFSVLGDMVSEIGGDNIQLTTIIGLGGDAHSFEPTPKQARALSEARVLVISGLGFEAWMPRLLAASNFKGQQIVASEGIHPRLLDAAAGHAHAEQGGSDSVVRKQGAAGSHQHSNLGVVAREAGTAADGHQHDVSADDHQHQDGEVDPHAWQSLTNGMIYARNIAEGLAKADPGNAADYRARAQRYIEEMKKLDTEVRQALRQIPVAKRKVVVPHDSLGYFGRDYGITFIPIMGISSKAEASARDVAKIVDEVRGVGGAAVFLEGQVSSKLTEQIARETGVAVGGSLYADTLSEPDQPAGTYLGMFKWNAGQLIYALNPSAR